MDFAPSKPVLAKARYRHTEINPTHRLPPDPPHEFSRGLWQGYRGGDLPFWPHITHGAAFHGVEASTKEARLARDALSHHSRKANGADRRPALQEEHQAAATAPPLRIKSATSSSGFGRLNR